jgi:hypothetical protein
MCTNSKEVVSEVKHTAENASIKKVPTEVSAVSPMSLILEVEFDNLRCEGSVRAPDHISHIRNIEPSCSSDNPRV